jgi:hypothetical protein
LLIVNVPVGGRKKKLYAIDETTPANSPVRRPNRLAAAITGIRAIQTVDVGVRYATAFSRAITIT